MLMIRILHSVSNMDRGGIETMLMNYYRHMDRSKVQFDFLCNKRTPGAYDEEIEKLGGKIYRMPGFNPFKYAGYVKRMRAIIEENGYGIIHVHNGPMGLYALNAAKRSGVRCRVYHAHGAGLVKHKMVLFKYLCKVLIPFNLTHRYACGVAAAQYYYGKRVVRRRDYTFIPNAIELDRYVFNPEARQEMRLTYGLEGRHVIGHIGRFTAEKNHVLLLRIFSEMKKADPKAYLVLVGDGELRRKVQDQACAMGLKEDVLFVGSVPNAHEWYQAFDVMVMPSLREGLPVVGVEAQTADLPCIFSDAITREIGLLEKVQFVSLAAPVECWVEAIQRALEHHERGCVRDVIAARGYDVKAEAEKLQDRYIELARSVE